MPVQEVLDNGARKYQGCRQFLIKPKPTNVYPFCWDSVIDKKVYETWITLAGDV